MRTHTPRFGREAECDCDFERFQRSHLAVEPLESSRTQTVRPAQAGGRRAIIKKYRYSVAVNDDQLYWPFQGEFWRDELGTYQYTLTKGCIERKTANQNVSDASAPAAK